MSKILNAVKKKFNILKGNAKLRYLLISVFALLLIGSVTLAWYINKVSLWGVEFNTGNIEFNTYVYDVSGTRLVGPVSSAGENESSYMNAPLMSLENAQVGTTGTAYIVVESTGSLGIQYRIAFDIAGKDEKSTAYLGGYKYNITKVTDRVSFNGGDKLDVTNSPSPEKINDDIVTIDKNAINGTLADKNGYDVYRVDYTLVQKNEEYTGASINIYYNIFATQIGGSFEETSERGYTYYCSTKEDLDRARVEAYPGDLIKLSADIVYYGDLVFNKPVSLETNDHSLTVNGNLIYDYVLGNSLKLDAGGLGMITVQCTKEGVGGNLQINAPIGEVSLIGANSANGDIVVEKNLTIDATDSYGSAGVHFSEVRIVDLKNSRKTIYLESNTRATVAFGTTLGLVQSVVKANNIEIINNGVIGEINLSNMAVLPQTNSPQIYILNNNDINSPIILPTWSEKFVEDASGVCTGNTRIIQSYSGSLTEVTGNCDFTNEDVEVEKKEYLVEQMEEGNDSRLKIYYQDTYGNNNSIQSILEEYLKHEATTGCQMHEILELEIISVGSKAVTSADIVFMNGNNMLALSQLNLQRANMPNNKLPDSAFSGVSKYQELILPQNLTAIGEKAFYQSKISNIVMIPSGVTEFGANWFNGGKYVGFAASVPIGAAIANNAINGVSAIFVEEAYIESYKSAYSAYATIIYPVSVLDETKEHFIRNTSGDEWEITYYISGSDEVIGDDITIDGTKLKITSVYDNAYRHKFTGSVVRFADSVTNVGSYNFYNNKKISEVDLNKVKTLGAHAFENCTIIQKVDFGTALETIGNNAFNRCTAIQQDVVLPETMKSIGQEAFAYCPITSVYTGGTQTVGRLAFAYCSSLLSADLSNVVEIGDKEKNMAFYANSKLVSIKLNSLVTAYSNSMFTACNSLREAYMATNNEDLNMGTNVFSNSANFKLYVPEAHLEFYQTKAPGGVSKASIYPMGEKMGEELVNGFNIGTYIVMANPDDSYTLVTSNIAHSGTLTIPETFDGKPITKIYANAFINQTFTSVTVKLGNNVKEIGAKAFNGLTGIVDVEFGDSLEVIGNSAFQKCTGWKKDVVLPASMVSIEASAFQDSGITGINTGGTTSIESNAFRNCTALVYAKMPELLVAAESGTNYIFFACTKLVAAHMPKLEVAYGMEMFARCTALREVYLESSSTDVSLGSNPFSQITSNGLKLYVPEDLLDFYKTKAIHTERQTYPLGEKMGDLAVNGYVIGDYIVAENDEGYTLVTCNLDFSGDLIVPDSFNDKPITKVGEHAFRNQTLTNANIYLGSSVKEIGANAFNRLSGLKNIQMDGVTTVGADAFNSSGLVIVNGPQLVTIGTTAFAYCTSLVTINLKSFETTTGTHAFSGCTNLKNAYFEKVKRLETYFFYNDQKLEKITINRVINEDSPKPENMSIHANAPCKIYVPYSALSEYGSTWSGKPVTSFDISGSAGGDTYILSERNGAYFLIDFVPGKTTTSLTLPATVSSSAGNLSIYSIESGAFESVNDTLKTLTLSASVAQMGASALSECAVLQTINVNADNKFFKSVDGVLYTKDGKMLVKYPTGKAGRFDMTAANFASTLGISAYAFANADAMTEIVFPADLMVIDGTAFTSCDNLQTVEFTGAKPPVLMAANMFDTAVLGFKIIIPTTSSEVVAAYLCSYNFAVYQPFIDLNGIAAPDASVDRNKVNLGD